MRRKGFYLAESIFLNVTVVDASIAGTSLLCVIETCKKSEVGSFSTDIDISIGSCGPAAFRCVLVSRGLTWLLLGCDSCVTVSTPLTVCFDVLLPAQLALKRLLSAGNLTQRLLARLFDTSQPIIAAILDAVDHALAESSEPADLNPRL